MVRAIRGATTVAENKAELIKEATIELLTTIVKKNNLRLEDIISAIFTVTPDLNADFPASSAREIGWNMVPLICATEIPVPGSLSRCIRVLIHINSNLRQDQIHHVYLREAVRLRQDLVSAQ